MSTKPFRRLLATATLALLGQFAVAPAAQAQVITVRPQARILQPIDGKVTLSFTNSTPHALAKAADLGPVTASTPMHVALVLKSSDAQEHALRTLLDQQHDSGTANFHKWITPDQFGASFGVADADLQKLTGWLQSQGFRVDPVVKGRRLITFDGTSGQVAAAFHTSMHRYKVGGETHISNSTDISVPSAIKEVLASAPSLNDFASQPLHTQYRQVTRGNDGQYVESVDGNFTSQTSGNHYMSPTDFAKIYNTTASGMDGTGVTIGIVGRSNILLADVQAYRRLFGLPDNDPVIAPVGVLAGHSTGDEVESDLDVEWAGGVAPKAKILFAPASSTLSVDGDNQVGIFSSFSDGVTYSAIGLVEANQADIISVSYGQCEASLGPGFWNVVWEQAAAQGQSVFVSSGDSGAAGCDAAGNPLEQNGFGVNVIASSNFNTAVGGTEFNEGAGTYWSPTNSPTGVSALGYIPESSWNEGFSVTGNPGSGLFASGGGVSTFFGRPSWQVGSNIPGVDPIDVSLQGLSLSGPHRLLPDVALAAAGNHDGAILCVEGLCSINPDGSLRGFGVVGGTSLAAPSFAGLQALINQKMGGRQGLANYQYYALSNQQLTSALACNAAGATLPDAKCTFNDTTTGNNGEINFDSENLDTSFTAGPGYDLVTGLGSVNATNLINNFGSVKFNSTTTTLTLSKTTFTRDQAVGATITVAPGSGTGTPTGDVIISAVNTYGSPLFVTLAGGTATGDLTGLPGGTYQVVARYAGDGVFASSTSTPITVTVGAEASATTSDLFSFTGGVKTTYDGGDAIAIDAFVASNSNSGIPTLGTVSFIDNGTTVATLPLNALGTVQLISGRNFTDFPTNAPAFAIGAHSVVAHFNGNASLNASSAAPIKFTVTKGAATVNLVSSAASITSGASVILNVSIPNIGSVAATGTVTFLDGTTPLGTQPLTNGSAVLTTTAITTAGAHPITASYAGDANYNAGLSPVSTVTVGNNQPTTLTLTAANAAPFVNQTDTYTATIAFSGFFPFGPFGFPGINLRPSFFPTGSVRFYDGANLLGTVPVNGLTATLQFAGLAVGAHNITAVYSGDPNFVSSTSAAAVVTPVANVTGLREINAGASTYGNPVSFQARVFANTPLTPILPSQPVQFFDGTTLLGTAPLVFFGDTGYYLATLTSNALGGGKHSITAVYSGDPNYTTATGLAPLSIVVAPTVSTTTLTLKPTTAIQGQTITLTANIAVSGPAPATGTVSFFDGTALLGTSPLNAAGVATLATSFLVTGPHAITATYAGDANYTGSSSTVSTDTTASVIAAFTVNANPSSLIVKHGENGFVAITVTPAPGFSGAVTLGCTNLPTNAVCSFSQSTVSGSQTVELILKGHQASSAVASMTRPNGDMPSPIPALAFWLPGAALSGFGLGRKRSARQRQLLLLAIFALGLGGMMGLTGCGAGNGVSAAPGTYNVQVTGTSGTITNSTPLTITIK